MSGAKRLLTTVCIVSVVFTSAAGPARQDHEDRQEIVIDVDQNTLTDVRRLYPETTLRDDGRKPYFQTIDLVDEFVLGEQSYRIVWISRGRVRHPHTLILDSAGRVLRQDWGLLQSEVEVIDGGWLRYRDHPLVNLNDQASLEHFLRHGHGAVLHRLAITRVEDALDVYLRNGRKAFLEQAPIRQYRDAHVRLPERVQAVEIYPSLVEDIRPSGFRYSSPWEATVFVRLIASEEGEVPRTLEIGASGWAEGIDASDVDLFLWATSPDDSDDRPASEPLKSPQS